MKKMIAVLLALTLLSLMIPALAEGAVYTPGNVDPEATEEAFAGEWVCLYAAIRGRVFETESNLADLGMETALTVKIENGLAVFTGIPELAGDEKPMTYADGALVFEPEAGIKVLTLQMLQDGVIELNFTMIQGGPTLYLFRVEAEDEAK